MAVIQGKVIQVKLNTNIPYAPQSGKAGGYSGYKILYENDNGETKEIAKAMASLKYTPAIREVLESLKPEDEFTLVQEKDEKGYLQVRSLVKGRDENATFGAAAQQEAAQPPAYQGNARSTVVGGRTGGNTYETPDERKVKQRLIVRQSSFAQAQQLLQIDTPLDELFETASKIEAWVYRGLE